MRRALAVAAVTVGLLGGGVVVAAPSQAATPKAWMTVKEYKKIKRGMTMAKVRSIVGSRGKLSSTYQWETGGYCDTYSYNYDYEYCLVYIPLKVNTAASYSWKTGRFSPTGGYVDFENGRVKTKSFYRIS